MQYPVHDEELFMEEALAAIRQAITNEEVGETLAPAEPPISREQAGVKPIPETGLLLRKATAAVGSAFNTIGSELFVRMSPAALSMLTAELAGCQAS
jgi:hypothetical protein